jgi:hypothetical protein
MEYAVVATVQRPKDWEQTGENSKNKNKSTTLNTALACNLPVI